MDYKNLETLIAKINTAHAEISYRWEKSDDYVKINLARKYVIDIFRSSSVSDLLDIIFKYRNFLCSESLNFGLELSSLGYEFRVKNQNSIESKLAVYMHKGEEAGHALNGEIPLIKCVNDLFGARYILKDKDGSLQDVFDWLKIKYPKLRITDSSKNDYKAIHVYFKQNNTTFPWDLQIWKQSDAAANKESHKKYKQDYTNWEKESKKEVD